MLRATLKQKQLIYCSHIFPTKSTRETMMSIPSVSHVIKPLDFFLSSFVKDNMYANNSKTAQKLKNNMHVVISDIESHLFKNLFKI